MDAGPGADLHGLGWFTAAWTVMIAAMMLPSLAPTAAVHSAMTGGSRAGRPLVFAGGYLLLWSAAGASAYAGFAVAKPLLATALAWDNGGRAAAATALALAALYELTPLKQACLSRCRDPSNPLGTKWRDGHGGALIMGIRAGGWCLGCCVGLMAALFALGVMSLTWMALIAGLVTLQKRAPWPRAATITTTVVLLALTAGVAAAPGDVPGLVVPGSPHARDVMKHMALGAPSIRTASSQERTT